MSHKSAVRNFLGNLPFGVKYYLVGLFDGCICFFSNFLIVFLQDFFPSPKSHVYTTALEIWNSFMSQNPAVHTVERILTFSIPAILCFTYHNFWSIKFKYKKLINFPFMFSIFGITGWIISFLYESGIVIYLRSHAQSNIAAVLPSTFILSSIYAMFSFSLSFFIMETFHRLIVLPYFFPGGHLKKYKALNPSIRVVINVFYTAVSIFPCTYIGYAFYSATGPDMTLEQKRIFHFFLLIVLIGFIIHLAFVTYATIPLKRLLKGTEEIKNGNYATRTDFVSNDDFGLLTDAFNDMTESLNAVQNSIIKSMAVVIESRDNSTGEHINRTSGCIQIFIEHLILNNVYPNCPDKFFACIAKAAPMHDLGKIAVDDSILRKPGKFLPEEYEKMKRHSEEGAKIVKQVLKNSNDESFKTISENIAHYHHEKWDGTGYPAHLKGKEIPLEARIMALADVCDALVSERCYKESYSFDKAFQIIEESLGTHFDPKLGSEFIKCRPAIETFYSIK
ncbi:MAG: HD domain-containing protein [Treponema sp.]|nr:HD domain-containing protein [Treponema sp.]